ncbi:MAG: choice-of-anchor I family protein [Chthoniobacterales bacterium]
MVAHDPTTQRLFVTNVAAGTLDVFDISDPNNPVFLTPIDVTPYGSQANSVAAYRGTIAAAVEAEVKTDPGSVVFFDAATGSFLSQVTVGALPDMLTFTPNGRAVLVANEGEPNDDYTIDPEGSVSVIDLKNGVPNLTQADVRTADFTAFNNAPLEPSVRIFGPNATVAQDLEPEYIAVSDNSKLAYVTLQENNAIGLLDVVRATFTRIAGLGFKDHSLPGHGIDASDEDDGINIANWPVKGMYQPDGIATFRAQGHNYLIMANEGDARDYSGFAEEERVTDLVLDPVAFPNAAELQADEAIGRLTVTSVNGDADHDGQYEKLFAFGGRSFSIRDTEAELVFDSGDALEQSRRPRSRPFLIPPTTTTTASIREATIRDPSPKE